MCMVVMSFFFFLNNNNKQTNKNNNEELAPYHAQVSFGIEEDLILPQTL